MSAPGPHRPWWQEAVGWTAVAVQLAMGSMVLALGLVVPVAPHATMMVAWLAATFATVLTRRSRPLRAPLVPLSFAVVVVAVVAAGGAWLGWTA